MGILHGGNFPRGVFLVGLYADGKIMWARFVWRIFFAKIFLVTKLKRYYAINLHSEWLAHISVELSNFLSLSYLGLQVFDLGEFHFYFLLHRLIFWGNRATYLLNWIVHSRLWYFSFMWVAYNVFSLVIMLTARILILLTGYALIMFLISHPTNMNLSINFAYGS